MRYEKLLATVEQQAGISKEQAERAAQVTLETLGERLSEGQARDLAEQLPPELRPWVSTDTRPDPFHSDEFLRRVAEREGVDPDTALRHARAVFAALGRAVSAEELADATSELPADFDRLLSAAEEGPRARTADGRERPAEPPAADEVVARVADHVHSDPQTARRALEAVLETLGERIAHGEVEDLAEELPDDLRPALERGDAESNGAARPLSLEEFLRHVAEREGVTPDEARDHARAVFLTMRSVVSEQEFSDMTAQLPRQYAAILARP